MNVLAIDTAGLNLTIALYASGKEYFVTDKSFKKASESLLVCTEQLLESAGITLNDISFFAISVGPGSFTGIRIGVTTVKAFCYSLNKLAMPVTRHDYLAYNVKATDKIVITDAGNGLCYFGRYSLQNELIKDIEVIGQLEAAKISGNNIFIETKDNCENNGKKLLDYAIARFNKLGEGALTDHNNITPVYIRKCQAELDRK